MDRTAGRGSVGFRRVDAWGTPEPPASSPPLAASAAADRPALVGTAGALLWAEATLARRTIGILTEDKPPDATGWYGRGRPGPALRVALLGDSSAAGYGVYRVEETPGAFWPAALAERADRRVHLREFAVVGAQSSDLAAQIDRALPHPAGRRGDPDRGQRRHPRGAAGGLGAAPVAKAVRRLREAGVEVVVGTCPDLGTIGPHRPAAEAGGPGLVAPAGGRPDHRRHRAGRAHGVARVDPRPGVRRGPGAAVRPRPVPPLGRRLPLRGAVLLPSVLAALRLVPDGRGRARAAAAARACCRSRRPRSRRSGPPGTELDGTEVGGSPARRPRRSGSSCGTGAGRAAGRSPRHPTPTRGHAERVQDGRPERPPRRLGVSPELKIARIRSRLV